MFLKNVHKSHLAHAIFSLRSLSNDSKVFRHVQPFGTIFSRGSTSASYFSSFANSNVLMSFFICTTLWLLTPWSPRTQPSPLFLNVFLVMFSFCPSLREQLLSHESFDDFWRFSPRWVKCCSFLTPQGNLSLHVPNDGSYCKLSTSMTFS